MTVSRGEELPRLTPKQQSVADLLLDIGSATVEEIKTLCGVGDGVLKNMEKCGVLRFFKKEKYRNPYADLPAAPKAAEIELSAEQTKAYHTLSAMLDGDGGSALLYGVTGSGKTQVYMRLIDRALQQGKDTIVPSVPPSSSSVSPFRAALWIWQRPTGFSPLHRSSPLSWCLPSARA